MKPPAPVTRIRGIAFKESSSFPAWIQEYSFYRTLNRTGKPTLKLSGAASTIASGLGVKNIALTITHTGNTALALVIFEG